MEQSEYRAELLKEADVSHDRILLELRKKLRTANLGKDLLMDMNDYLTKRSASLKSDQKNTIDRHLNNLKSLSQYSFSLQGKLKRAEEKSFKINMNILEDVNINACQKLIDTASETMSKI